jgi:hypothetical protein
MFIERTNGRLEVWELERLEVGCVCERVKTREKRHSFISAEEKKGVRQGAAKSGQEGVVFFLAS